MMGLEINTKYRQENLVSVHNPNCPDCIDILRSKSVVTPDAKTKEAMQPSRGQMTNTSKPGPDIIPQAPDLHPNTHLLLNTATNTQRRETHSGHIREVKGARH